MRQFQCLGALIIAFLWLCTPLARGDNPKRGQTPDDLLRTQSFGYPAISPDSNSVAFMLSRPRADLSGADGVYKSFDNGELSGDIWIASRESAAAENITLGAKSHTGYWLPDWSPDGSRLAAISVQEGYAHLTIWNVKTRRFQEITSCNLDVAATNKPFQWLASDRLICGCIPVDSPFNIGLIIPQKARMDAWMKSWNGGSSTANVLESPLPPNSGMRPLGQVLIVDIDKGVIASIDGRLSSEFAVAKNQRLIAFSHYSSAAAVNDNPLTGDQTVHGELMVVDTDGRAAAKWSREFNDLSAATAVHWSPTGDELAVATPTRFHGPKGASEQWLRCSIQAGSCHPFEETSHLGPVKDVLWLEGGESLVYAAKGRGSTGSTAGDRNDWWLVPVSGNPSNLTIDLQQVPSQLLPERAQKAFVGEAGGKIWKLQAASPHAQQLTFGFDGKVSILLPDSKATEADIMLLSEQRQGAKATTTVVDLSSGGVSRLTKPGENANLVGFSPIGKTSIYSLWDNTGSYLWVCWNVIGECTSVVVANTFLRDVAQLQTRQFEYRTLNGQNAQGIVYLPVDYSKGMHYPLITDVYLGRTNAGSNFAALLTSHGYAVLSPDMPLPDNDPTNDISPQQPGIDPYMELSNGVLPAIEKLVDLGIVDPERVGLIGHSYGGYSAMGLLTQTRRFKAAVSLAGISDLVSYYGSFGLTTSYTPDTAEIALMRMSQTETGQNNMWNPPWTDSGRYVRNSPIFYANRIDTPLMIVAGDMDDYSATQAEEMFSALYRQQKRAELVRYIGEEHVIYSPPNVKDLWRRIYAWFDEFLKQPDPNKATAQ
jgi:dipeptidyl aminopeptidase/acylaminoacyl peptidase